MAIDPYWNLSTASLPSRRSWPCYYYPPSIAFLRPNQSSFPRPNQSFFLKATIGSNSSKQTAADALLQIAPPPRHGQQIEPDLTNTTLYQALQNVAQYLRVRSSHRYQGLGAGRAHGTAERVGVRVWRRGSLEVWRSRGPGANRTINPSVPKLMEDSVGHGEVDRSEGYDQVIATKVWERGEGTDGREGGCGCGGIE